ncbi:MAG: glycosyltransferase family 2 protein [Kouleothrix sp.]|nr:glycosyltransferase family 2 protein [Kouleothrix sp.]
MTNLAIIIVSWNTCELLRRCLTSVHASLADSGIAYTIVVVDNRSSDGTPTMLRAEHPEVLLIESGRNLGFAGGNNLALRQVLRSEFKVLSYSDDQNSTLKTQNSELDYVFLLNPDTEVVGDAIPRLVRYLAAHPDVAVVGPRLRYTDGSAQPSRRRFPTPGTYFWESTPLEQRWPGNPWARRYRYDDKPDDAEQEVDWLVGAALLVRREAIERAGLLDAGFLMYSEELEWQRRIRGLGFEARDLGRSTQSQAPSPKPQAPTIMYLPDAVIVHHEGKSSEQALARRYLNFQRSRIREAGMVYGERFAAGLRLFLRAAYTAELAVEAAKWLVGHRRPLRARRVVVYWQVVRGL